MTFVNVLTYLCNECSELVQVTLPFWIQSQLSYTFIELLSSLIWILKNKVNNT